MNGFAVVRLVRPLIARCYIGFNIMDPSRMYITDYFAAIRSEVVCYAIANAGYVADVVD